MDIAIISDTHIPSRAPALPESVRDRLRTADHVIHAGDFDSAAAFDEIRDLASGLTAVTGNMDPGLDLPRVATVDLAGVSVVVTHGTGSPAGYEGRVAAVVRETVGRDAVGVAGHTHEPLDTVHEGVRLLNPGSATGAPPASRTTMLTAVPAEDTLDVTVQEV